MSEYTDEQRGQWMISHVYAVLEKGEDALQYAEETMRLTTKHDFKDFDLAYAYESMARAHAALRNKLQCQTWLTKASDAGELISDAGDKKYFQSDLSSEPWFGCK